MCFMRFTLFCFVVNLFCAFNLLIAQSGNTFANFKERKELAVAELKNHPGKDTARVNALVRILLTATFSKEHKELFPYKEEALTISKQLNYDYGIAQYYYATANYLKTTSDYVHALDYYDSTLTVIGNSGDSRLPQLSTAVFERKGLIYYSQENYSAAIKSFFQVLKDEGNKRNTRVVRVNCLITDCYQAINNLDKAAEYALRNIAIIEKDTSLKYQGASSYLAFVDVSLARNDLKNAEVYLKKLKPFAENPFEVQVSCGYHRKNGHVHYAQQKYAEAFSDYQTAFEFAKLGNHNNSVSAVLADLSRTALKLGKVDEARLFATKNLALTDEMTTTAPKVEALINLADYYHSAGNNAKAFELASTATELKDTMIAEMNIRQVNLLSAMYDRETQQKEIKDLHTQKQQQEAAAKQTLLMNRVFLGFIAMLLILGYLGFLNFRKGRQLAESQHELQRQKIMELEKERQLVGMTAMMKGQEEERSRIAKDLHDGFGGMLSGTKLSFIHVKDRLVLSAEDRLLFEKSLSMLDNTIGDLRKVAHNLMPEALVKFGLQDALLDFCNYIKLSTGLEVLYQQFGEQRKLDSTAEIFIYRIVQELLNNVVKHAQASQVLVQFAMDSQKVSITVEDNGKGFDKKILSNSKGAGMSNVMYRAECLNGRTDIVTSPGEGTSVNIELFV